MVPVAIIDIWRHYDVISRPDSNTIIHFHPKSGSPPHLKVIALAIIIYRIALANGTAYMCRCTSVRRHPEFKTKVAASEIAGVSSAVEISIGDALKANCATYKTCSVLIRRPDGGCIIVICS